MPAEVYDQDIVAYAEGSDTPWHRTNCVTFKVDDPIETQWESTSLKYTIGVKPLFTEEGEKVSHRAVYRTDTNTILGVVGPKWAPFQPLEVRDELKRLVDDGILKLHTAGSLRNGGRMWAQCTIVGHEAKEEVIPGDDILQYFTITQGFDGLLGVHTGWTRIRQVCANTVQASLLDEKSKLVRIRHNRLVADNVRKLIESIDWSNQQFNMTIEKFKYLTTRGCSRQDLRKYVRIVLDIKPDEEYDKLGGRSKNVIQKIETLAETGKGSSLPGVKGTWWGAYNSITEYLNYVQGRNADNRLDNLWFGTGKNMLNKALDVALALAT